MPESRRRRWVERRSLGRRHTDRKWPRHLRDFWMVIVTALVLLALLNQRSTNDEVAANQRHDTTALCSLRGDLQKRVRSGNDYLKTHPHGIPGVPVATLRTSIDNAQHSLNALHPLVCVPSQRRLR